MRNLWGILRDIMWLAVFALVLGVACLVVAIINPDAVGTIAGLGLSGVTLALLAQRG